MDVPVNPSTLAVERHNGHLWLCCVDGAMSVLLARFSGAEQAEQFKAALNQSLMSARACGELGL